MSSLPPIVVSAVAVLRCLSDHSRWKLLPTLSGMRHSAYHAWCRELPALAIQRHLSDHPWWRLLPTLTVNRH
jgi:hypothetical protein